MQPKQQRADTNRTKEQRCKKKTTVPLQNRGKRKKKNQCNQSEKRSEIQISWTYQEDRFCAFQLLNSFDANTFFIIILDGCLEYLVRFCFCRIVVSFFFRQYYMLRLLRFFWCHCTAIKATFNVFNVFVVEEYKKRTQDECISWESISSVWKVYACMHV